MSKNSRTYYCKTCQESITFQKDEVMKCSDCNATFGKYRRIPFEINMRTTWSGQTQVEFTSQSMEESVKDKGGTW